MNELLNMNIPKFLADLISKFDGHLAIFKANEVHALGDGRHCERMTQVMTGRMVMM
jgi:hypothetical protein